MANKRDLKKKANCRAVVQSAQEIFLEKPYSSITVDEIAKSAGVTKRTLYTYFPSKLALFIQMFDDYLQQLHRLMLEALNDDLRPDRALQRIIEGLFQFTKENDRFMRLFWSLDSAEFEGEIPEELVRSIRLWNQEMIDRVVELVKKGQQQGLVVACDPELLVHLISAFNKGIIIHTNKESNLNIANVDPESLKSLLLELISDTLFPVAVRPLSEDVHEERRVE